MKKGVTNRFVKGKGLILGCIALLQPLVSKAKCGGVDYSW